MSNVQSQCCHSNHTPYCEMRVYAPDNDRGFRPVLCSRAQTREQQLKKIREANQIVHFQNLRIDFSRRFLPFFLRLPWHADSSRRRSKRRRKPRANAANFPLPPHFTSRSNKFNLREFAPENVKSLGYERSWSLDTAQLTRRDKETYCLDFVGLITAKIPSPYFCRRLRSASRHNTTIKPSRQTAGSLVIRSRQIPNARSRSSSAKSDRSSTSAWDEALSSNGLAHAARIGPLTACLCITVAISAALR